MSGAGDGPGGGKATAQAGGQGGRIGPVDHPVSALGDSLRGGPLIEFTIVGRDQEGSFKIASRLSPGRIDAAIARGSEGRRGRTGGGGQGKFSPRDLLGHQQDGEKSETEKS